MLLLAVSVYIRTTLHESPVFKEMKAQGKGSKNPIWESFAHWYNAKYVLLALFGAVRRARRRLVHGPVLRAVLHAEHAARRLHDRLSPDRASRFALGNDDVSSSSAGCRTAWAAADHAGGCLLAAITYFPIFQALTSAVNRRSRRRNREPGDGLGRSGTVRDGVFADPHTACQKVMAQLSKGGVQYAFTAAPGQA